MTSLWWCCLTFYGALIKLTTKTITKNRSESFDLILLTLVWYKRDAIQPWQFFWVEPISNFSPWNTNGTEKNWHQKWHHWKFQRSHAFDDVFLACPVKDRAVAKEVIFSKICKKYKIIHWNFVTEARRWNRGRATTCYLGRATARFALTTRQYQQSNRFSSLKIFWKTRIKVKLWIYIDSITQKCNVRRSMKCTTVKKQFQV